MHTSVESTYQMCQNKDETIGHILSSCESPQWSLLKERHDRVVYRLMMGLAKRLEVMVAHSMTWGLTGWQGAAELKEKLISIITN